MSRHVFTYGSLMFADVWSRVVKGRYASIEGRVEHHARYAIDGADYPGMVARDGSRVTGRLYLDIDDDDLRRLDEFEGVDYRRDVVTVTAADGIVRDAETYVYLRGERLLDTAWVPEEFAMQRFLETYCRDRLGP
jgi:gamma-glutamylcyclotransferase (GGCT)/AIG2-like uncharacterized protein YtfP